MNFQILLFFLLLLIYTQNTNTIYASNPESDTKNSSASFEQLRLNSSSKIHPILTQWQTSENPNEFAKENNLSYKENKVGVYIYLESAESRSKIPPEINVTAFDDKIVVAFVSSAQLDKLEELDFVERVTPPERMRTPPIPQIETPEIQTLEENQYDYLVWIVIGGIAIITIGILKKKKLKD